jgi:ribose 5-phosphate isomerase B
MKFVVGSDHGGLEVKDAVVALLKQRGATVIDAGTDGPASVDYPDFGMKVAGMVSRGEADQGVLVCGTGIGMSIVANKYPEVRAALVTDEFMARMARQHNNANVLVLGGRVVDVPTAEKLVTAWLDATFEGGRHQGRLDKISAQERELGLSK